MITTDAEPADRVLSKAWSSPFRVLPASSLGGVLANWVQAIHCGAIYADDGWLCVESQRIGGAYGDTVVAVNPVFMPRHGVVDTLPGDSLFIGPFMLHYGHFISETLSRLRPSMNDPKRYERLVAFPFSKAGLRLERFHTYILGCLGIDGAAITTLQEPVGFERIEVPEQLWQVNVGANLAVRDVYRKINSLHVTRTPDARVFLSRTRSPRLQGIGDIEAAFERRGFRVIYPETIPIEEQLSIYASADIIAGISGSAMHNCVFASEWCATIEIGDARSPERPHPMQRIANAIAGIPAAFVPYTGGADGVRDNTSLASQIDEALVSLSRPP